MKNITNISSSQTWPPGTPAMPADIIAINKSFNISSEYDEQYPYLVLAKTIFRNWAPIFVSLVGIFGNVISFFITTKKEYRHISTCLYMSALAAVDTVFLVEYLIDVPFFFGLKFTNHLIVIRFLTYAMYSSATSSRLILAAMTADRACAVFLPLKARSLCTVSHARKVIVMFILIPAVVNINMMFTYAVVGEDFDTIVLSVRDYPWLEIIITIYQSAVLTVIPFSVILISNILIVFSVRRAATNMNKLGQDNKQGSSENKHLTRMLLLVSLAFVLCCAPYTLFEIFYKILALVGAVDYSAYWTIRMGVIGWGTAAITQANHAVNFYLYVLGGGKKFRTDAINVLRLA
ncbi:FMRFamide peptide receptor frpr-18-like [Lineus longissimus]|uniref:FMRFamide peptide receptor frpr-18-like n=1 Tax=Lineus longissimus TaxID=88925 RepID=UPI00315CED2B